MEHKWFAPWKILIRIRILMVIGIIQIDEINIIVVIVRHCDRSDRKKLSSSRVCDHW